LIQYQECQKKQEQEQEHNSQDIQGTAKVWCSGSKRRPTMFLPYKLSKKYGMDEPCRVIFMDSGNGILIQFLCKAQKSDEDVNNNDNNY
jgi:hypothetical protein